MAQHNNEGVRIHPGVDLLGVIVVIVVVDIVDVVDAFINNKNTFKTVIDSDWRKLQEMLDVLVVLGTSD